ncbi:MAG TPA: MFS transporter [Candidatus Eisenbacteria bacterium]|nr:MFS transporter [Candidatus Eisenbacteria bacterium]
MRWPNLLATRRGRLAAFFLLYLTEGIPSGFSGTALATQMRRQGLEPAVIGSFIAALYLPWAVKWAFGPFVDVLSVERWGRRRMWILLTQTAMAVTLVVAMGVDFRTHLALFTAIILLHNVFAATQDVAIDALAVNVLGEDERGLANGLMFGGQYVGIALGGSGVLFLTAAIGFQPSFLLVAGAILLVTALVPLPMREPPGPPRPDTGRRGIRALAAELGLFARDTAAAFTSSRSAFLAIFLALLPMGAYALSFSLQSNLAVELGLSDREVGTLGLVTTILAAGFCVLGGWLSDRFGRRRTLALFIACTTVPTLFLAAALQRFGWIVPIDPQLANRPLPAPELVTLFWAAALTYAIFQGLMYGVGTAIFMDVTSARVAATQFTAYMALTNLVFSYSSFWQGHAMQRWGYPMTLVVDAAFGLLSLGLLPFMGAIRRAEPPPPGAAIPELTEP